MISHDEMMGIVATEAADEAAAASLQPLVRAPVSDTEMALNYYRAAAEDRRPDYVPARIRLTAMVHCDMPLSVAEYYDYVAEAGEHDCESNQWGAVSVKAKNGRMLGVKPKEFEAVTWRPNEKLTDRPE